MEKASEDNTKKKDKKSPLRPRRTLEEKLAIGYFKERLTFNNYHYGTKKYIATNGKETYLICNIMEFTPKEDEVVFEIRAKTRIECKRIPCNKREIKRKRL